MITPARAGMSMQSNAPSAGKVQCGLGATWGSEASGSLKIFPQNTYITTVGPKSNVEGVADKRHGADDSFHCDIKCHAHQDVARHTQSTRLEQ
jgi:hypothetical protein